MKKKSIAKKIITVICVLIAAVVAFVAGFLIYASVTTLKVQDSESMEIHGSSTMEIQPGSTLTLLTWNVGYGALDERQDCYWDGGTGVDGESEAVVQDNINAIKAQIAEVDPDIFLLQEVDIDSKRSYNIDELSSFTETFTEDTYNYTFARNFKAGFIPIPLYNPTGRVEAGISTFTKYSVTDSTRVQLPIPFSWPVNLLNLKRCLLVNRMPIAGSDKELVMINLHLEAYDDGEGKAKQLAILMDIMEEELEKGNYVIAGGDFNQTFSTTDYQQYPKMNDWVCPVISAEDYPSFTFGMDSTHPTCRSLYRTYADADKTDFQYYMIDGYIVSENITINDLQTLDLDFQNTDHNPVILSVTLD